MTKIIKTDAYVQDKALGLEERATPTAIADVGQLYVKDVAANPELYYYDGVNAELQITTVGGLNVPPVDTTKLVNGTAEALLTPNSPELVFSNPVEIGHLRLTYNSVLLGLNAGDANTAVGTVAIGEEAGKANIASVGNIFMGYQAGLASTGVNNTIIGFAAADTAGFSGTDNTVMGYNALGSANGAANYNTIMGSQAGDSITSGDENVLVGYLAGTAITSTSSNTLIGTSAGTAINAGYNTVTGCRAGDSIGGGTYNAIYGYEAATVMNAGSAQNTILGAQAAGGTSASVINKMTAIGYQAAYVNTAEGTVAIGCEAGKANTSSVGSTYIGYQAGLNATGANNTVVGYAAGDGITSSFGITAVGSNCSSAALLSPSGNYLTAFGYNAAAACTMGDNTCIGYSSGLALTTCKYNTFVGYESGKAMLDDVSGGSTFVGHQAGAAATGAMNTIIGADAGEVFTSGTTNVLIGKSSGARLTGGSSAHVIIGAYAGYASAGFSNSVLIGYQAGYANTSSGTVAVGYEAGKANASSTGSTYIGYQAGVKATGANNTCLGYQAGDEIVAGANNVIIGVEANSAASTSYVTAIGVEAGKVNTADYAVFLGWQAGMAHTSTYGCMYMGPQAGFNSTGADNVIIGPGAAYDMTTGAGNTFVGRETAVSIFGQSDNNVGIGYRALGSAPGTPATRSSMVAIGYYAGYEGMTDGGVAVGSNAAENTTGDGMVAVGFRAARANTTGIGITAVGYQAGASTQTVDGSTFLGYNAGVNATGGYNTLLGYSAGSSITTGANNVIIGPAAGIAADNYQFFIADHATNPPILEGLFHDDALGAGGSSSLLKSNVVAFQIHNPKSNLEQFRVYAGKLSTYGETAPDVEIGGLCLMVNDDTYHVISLKENGMTHGCTTGFTADTDTWGYIKHKDVTTGGLLMAGISNAAAGADGQGIKLLSGAKTVTNAGPDPTGTYAGMELVSAKVNGANLEKFAENENVFYVRNYTDCVFAVDGSGDLFAGNATVTVLDEEDDIKLVKSFSTGGVYYDRLRELGVVTQGGMFNINKMNMLSIGAIGQLFNIIRALAVKLGVSEDELYALAKQY